MTKQTKDLTPAMLAEEAVKRGTPVIELEPCDKCRNPAAIYFYQREGRTHNGCLWCRHIEGKAPLSANGLEVVPYLGEVDENGVGLVVGKRRCKCGNKMKLAVNAYGVNAGKCSECARLAWEEKEHGKEFKRVNRTVSAKVHKFIVQSIERSGVVEVAPRSFAEFIEVRELAYRCQIMNEREARLETGIRWELGHKFPAMVEGELRGKATADNLYIVQKEQNRATGNDLPEEWTITQVVNVSQCRAIQRSYEASQAWRLVKGSWSDDTAAAKRERQQKEQTAQKEHAERVRAIVGDAVKVMEFFAVDDVLSFERMLDVVQARWDKITVKMDRIISAFIQSGRNVSFTEAREQRLTVEAFCGATARLHAVVMTLQQIADAESILRDGSLPPEQEEQLETVKRCAVLWGQEVLSNDKVLVMGFTHPLLNVLGNPLAWGTVEDEHGKQWLCAWKNHHRNLEDELTPFDAPAAEIDQSKINPALLRGSSLPYETVKVFAEGWQNTEEIHLYEQAEKRKAREAAARKKAQQEATRKAHSEALRAQVSKSITSQIERLRSDWATWENELYCFAGGEFQEALQEDAYSLINDAREQVFCCVSELENMLADGQEGSELEKDWRYWQMTNTQKIKGMMLPANVFADLLHPF
ncbi:hypothetical protein III71_004572 [Salmonella enterica subsp. enterica serovar Newport]|nr:hypothetical protein [Salmonella enterica subsp. enterica serovar Newport]